MCRLGANDCSEAFLSVPVLSVANALINSVKARPSSQNLAPQVIAAPQAVPGNEPVVQNPGGLSPGSR